MRKSLLSVVLILCMLLTFCPAVFAAGETSAPEVSTSADAELGAEDVENEVVANQESVSKPTSAFTSFTYDCWGNTVQCPDPYTLVRRVDGVAMGLGDIKKVIDVYADSEGFVYLSTNGDEEDDNTVIKMDTQLNVIAQWKGYYDKGKFVHFVKPAGIFVTNEGEVYICDSSTLDVYHFTVKDDKLNLVMTIDAPSREDSAVIDEDFIERYIPAKLVVDHTDRVYVVATNVNEGIVTFTKEGKFDGFLAAGKVTVDPFTKFMKKYIYTEAQKARVTTFVPIEYNNIDLDKEGFIFSTLAATNESTVLSEIKSKKGTEAGALVRRLNMMGTDILKRDGYTPPVGDTDVDKTIDNKDATYQGISQITDVSTSNYGTYAILDNNRNHIFVYNNEGYMLYAFSGPDATAGGMTTPIALAQCDNYMYVLDSNSRSIFLFQRTDFSNSVIEAIALEKSGKYSDASKIWSKVLDYDAVYDLAYLGLGKTAYWNRDYQGASELFKLCNNQSWYSKAWAEIRKDVLAQWFMPVVVVILAIVVLSFVLKIVKKRKNKAKKGDAG